VRWITSYLAAYTGNCGINYSCDPTVLSPPISVSQGYFASQAPQDDVTFLYTYFDGQQEYVTSLKVTFELDVYNIIGINDLAGSISYSGNFVYTWNDKNLAWNESLTPMPNDESLLIPSSWVWTPDVKILDQVSDDLSGNSKVVIYPNGSMFYSPLFKSEAACRLDLKAFPFDTQSCTVEYLPTIEWVGTGMRFEKPKIFISPDVSPTSWQVGDCSITKDERVFTGNGSKSVVTVTFSLRRYTSFYWITAIIPCILIVLIAVGSLWLNDYSTRLSVVVTAMLTVVAIVWSISSSIPVSKKTTWIESFCRTSIVIIAAICLQSTLAAFMATRTVKISAREKSMFDSLVAINRSIISIALCAALRRTTAKVQSNASSNATLSDGVCGGASPMVSMEIDQEKSVDGDDAREACNTYSPVKAMDDAEADEQLQIRKEWEQYAHELDFTCKLITIATIVAFFVFYFN